MSAAAVRDRPAAHARLGSTDFGRFSMAGVGVAALGAVTLFVLPALARSGGYPGAATALIAVSLPLAAAMVATRTWGLARIAGARSTGELIAHHYGTTVAALVALATLAAAALLLSLVLIASGQTIEAMSGRRVNARLGMYLSAVFVALTAAPAGIRAAAALGRTQGALLALGALALLGLSIVELGGARAAIETLARAAEFLPLGTTEGRGGGDYPAALALTGALGIGNGRSGLTVLARHAELAGILLLLCWLPWSIAADQPRQTGRPIVGTALCGIIVLALAGGLGWTAFSLGTASAPSGPTIPTIGGAMLNGTVTTYVIALAARHPWIVVPFGLAALAALHALAHTLVAATVGALRPLAGRRLRNASGSLRELAAAQLAALALVAAAAVLPVIPISELLRWSEFVFVTASVAVLPILAICWFPKLTAGAMTAALVAGSAAALAPMSLELPAIYGALLGPAVATSVALVVTALKPRDSRRARRLDALQQLDELLIEPGEERGQGPLLGVAALAWIFFAIGPGAVLGNDVFGRPDTARASWEFVLPSIGVWQIIAWASGAALVWFAARRYAQLDRRAAAQLTALDGSTAAAQTDRPAADR